MTSSASSRRSRTAPVRILGAGLSGLSAAMGLLQHGFRPILYERTSQVSGRFTRDFQALRNYVCKDDIVATLAKGGIRFDPVGRITTIIRYSPTYEFAVTSAERPLYYLVERGPGPDALDGQLHAQLEASGVVFEFGSQRTPLEVEIVATGPQTREYLLYGGVYRDVDFYADGSQQQVCHVFLDLEAIPNGYLYVLPGRDPGEAEIVAACENTDAMPMERLRSAFERYIGSNERFHRLFGQPTRIQECIGYGSRGFLSAAVEQDGRLYVGEAGHLQDPTAGFGLRYAMRSGLLAAAALAGDRSYHQLLQSAFGAEIEHATTRSQRIYSLTNRKLDALFTSVREQFGARIPIEAYDAVRAIL